MAFSPNAATVFADGPSADPYQPSKDQIRSLLTQYETILNAVGVGAGSEAKATKAELFADLSYNPDQTVWVYADPTPANNGIWRKLGAPGTGSFVYALPLPFSFIPASDSGEGTSNAIKATSALPIVDGVMVILDVAEANDASPVTVQFNGNAVLTMKTSSGNEIPAGAFTAGMQVLGVKSGSEFRLASDIASAAIQAASEAAAALAEAWAEGTLPGGALTKSAKEWALVAQSAVTYNRASARGTTGTGAPANVGPYNVGVAIGSINNIDIKLGGVIQDHTSSVYTISGNTFTFVDDPGAGIPWEAVVQTEVRELGAPSDGTVGTDQLQLGAVGNEQIEDESVEYSKLGPSVVSLFGEFGSIMPVVKGGTVAGTATYSVQSGTYRLVSGMVFFNLELVWTGGTGSGDMYVDGLPYISAGINTPVVIAAQGITFTGDDIQAVQLANRTDILFQNRANGGGGPLPYDAAGTLRLSGMYPAGVRRDLVWMGDSVTYAVRPGVTEKDSFRTKVQNGRRWAFGLNKGVPGENASEMRARFTADVVARQPQAVHIMTGINDFFDGYSAASMKDDLAWMVNQAQAAGITVTLSSATATQNAGMLAGFGPYLTAQQEVGAMSGVIYVPVYERFMDLKASMSAPAYAALFVDEQHIGPLGHDVVANLILSTPNAC